MFLLYKFAGSLVVPPGCFIVAILVIAALAMRRPLKPFLAGALCVLAAALYAMSTPAGALLITGPLEARYETKLPPDGESAAFLVLAGGSSYDDTGSSAQPSPLALERLYVAVTFASMREGNAVLVLSGGDVFGDNDRSEAAALSDAARAMGWSGEIILEEQSRTTAENMKYSAAVLRARNMQHVAVITNAFHLPRAMRFARQFMPGATLYPIAPPRQAYPIIRGLPSFLPNAQSLYLSCLGARERIGAACAAVSAAIR